MCPWALHTPADPCLPWLWIHSWVLVSILQALGYSAVGCKMRRVPFPPLPLPLPQAPTARGQPGLRDAEWLAHGAVPYLTQIVLPTLGCTDTFNSLLQSTRVETGSRITKLAIFRIAPSLQLQLNLPHYWIKFIMPDIPFLTRNPLLKRFEGIPL